MAVAVAVPTLLYAYVGWRGREAVVNDARARLARVAQIAEQHAGRVVETNEVLYRLLDRSVAGLDDRQVRALSGELHEELKAVTQGLRQVQSVWLWDADGRPLISSRFHVPPAVRVEDRDYFIAAREAASGSGWVVSRPHISRSTGEPFFDLARPRHDADGTFRGVVSVSLFPDYFVSFFREQAQQDPAFSVALFRKDGTVIARFPEVTQGAKLKPGSPLLGRMQAGSPHGATEGISSIDQRLRYVAYRQVANLPLYAVATADQSLVLATWTRSMVTLAAFTFPLVLAILVIGWFGLRLMRRDAAVESARREETEGRLRAEEALRRAQKLEALGRLTGGVAHDFNNLMMVVQSSADLLPRLAQQGKPLDGPLAAIRRAIASGTQLTRQLLAFARRQPLQVETLDLAEVLPALRALLQSSVGAKVQVEVSVANVPLRVAVDRAEMELALLNLAMNARDAMPDGGRLLVECRGGADADDGTGWGVEIRVTDTGCGIPAALIPQITEPFFTTKPMGKGTGLGLSQVDGFASQAGGRLEISSVPGQGTCVRLWLPPATDDADLLSSPPAQQTPAHPSLAVDLLLVEDNADVAAAIEATLSEAGVSVQRVANAEAAMNALQSRYQHGTPPDVVLSDINMPGLHNGIELARQVLDRWPGLHVLLMTGYTEQLQIAVRQQLTVLPKPVAPLQLLKAIEEIVGHDAGQVVAPSASLDAERVPQPESRP